MAAFFLLMEIKEDDTQLICFCEAVLPFMPFRIIENSFYWSTFQ